MSFAVASPSSPVQRAALTLLGLISWVVPARAVPRPLDLVGSVVNPSLSGLHASVVSPDGSCLYLVGNGISTFSRDAATDTFTLIDSDANGNGAPALSPDAKHLYVSGSNGIAVYARNPVTGVLTFVEEEVRSEGEGATSIAVSPDGKHVYVAGTFSNTITVYSRNAVTGAITLVQTVHDDVGGVDGLREPSSVAVSPDGAHVYTTGAQDDAVAVFSRNAVTGTLTFVEVQRDGVGGVDGLARALSVAVSPDGAHVYVAGQNDNAVAVFGRNAGTGALTFVEVQRDGVGGVDGLSSASFVTLSPDGAHVYVMSRWGQDGLAVFARNAGTGMLSFVEAEHDGMLPNVQGPNWLSVSADGTRVYAPGEQSGTLVFDRNGATGALARLGTLTFPVASALALSPDGMNGYGVDGFQGSIITYDRAPATGALTFVSEMVDGLGQVDGLAGARSVLVSPDGDNVYVASSTDDAVATFSRAPGSGALTPVAVARDGVSGVDGLDGASSVAISPDGAHVYVASAVDDAVAVFSRAPGTGLLGFVELKRDGVAGVDGLDGAVSVAVSSDGADVYVASADDDAVAVFSRNPGTGSLTFVEVQREGVGGIESLDGATAVAVSPDGAHVYVASRGDETLTTFARNAGTGALTFVQFERQFVGGVKSLDAAHFVVVSPDGAAVYASGSAVATFSRDAATGVVTFVQESARAGLADGEILSVSPDSTYVYQLGGLISIYTPGYSGCGAAPESGCLTTTKDVLSLRARNKRISWKWLRGQTDVAALGDPNGANSSVPDTSYALCLYDESMPTPGLIFRALAPAGRSCATSPSGHRDCWIAGHPSSVTKLFKYGDRSGTPEGLTAMRLRGGPLPKARMVVRGSRGSGRSPALPSLPLALPLRVQLQASNGTCWEATYASPRTNTVTTFRARHP